MMRVLAFYLPQFHPIPENDTWWGKGFTEWYNVTRARPLFEGHFQPRLPTDLGFYDLRLPEVMQAQVELAKQYRIHGFCYHYYWFKGGRRLLERPLEQMLNTGNLDFPFCLCWANENWTRRWDGQDREILMPQLHDAESDIAFLHSVLPYFRDPRYIRVGNRPLLVVYRATLFPNLAATVARWHNEAMRLGESPPYLVAAESFDVTPNIAATAGFDATCEFPPHGTLDCAIDKECWPDFQQQFSGLILDYGKVVSKSLARPANSLRRFRTVTLNWDNTARKNTSAHLMQGFSLVTYHHWLSGAIKSSLANDPEDERFVFINAWNEWAEGTYLEPDQIYGHAYLEATRAAILGQSYKDCLPTTLNNIESPSLTSAIINEAVGENRETYSAEKGELTLIGIAMIGNEADIIEAFIRENCRFLDHLFVAEHNALDGTSEILSALQRDGLPITIIKITARAFEQTKVTNRLLKEALERFSPDWILPLDADEFIDAGDRRQLEYQLLTCTGMHARIAWMNHAPTSFDDPHEVNPLKRMRYRYSYPTPDPNENPWVWKIFLNCSLITSYLDRYELEKGSHRIVFRGTKEPSIQPARNLAAIRLRHFAIRSYDQLSIKIGIGRIQSEFSTSKNEHAGIHLRSILKSFSDGAHDVGFLQSGCREYLDTGRLTADQTSNVPLIADPFPAKTNLSLTNLRIPASGMLIRWLLLQKEFESAKDLQ